MEKGRRNVKKGKDKTGGEAPLMKRDLNLAFKLSGTCEEGE